MYMYSWMDIKECIGISELWECIASESMYLSLDISLRLVSKQVVVIARKPPIKRFSFIQYNKLIVIPKVTGR